MRVNEDLLKRLKAGEEKAFEDLYWTYSPQVYNFINSLLFDKSLAEDLTQNVFIIGKTKSTNFPNEKYEKETFEHYLKVV